jgi:hypothetical protein
VKDIKGLNIVIGPVDISIQVVEVYVGDNERSVFLQEPLDIGKLLFLNISDVFEYALGHNKVELPVSKLDRVLREIGFNQV